MSFQPGASAGGGTVDIGTIIAYLEFTSTVTVSGTSGAMTTVVTAPAFRADGSSYWVEFSSQEVIPGSADFVVLNVFEDGTSIGQLAVINMTVGMPTTQRRRITPAAGEHTYSIRAYRVTNNGSILAGAGGNNVAVPGYISITKAA